MPSLFENDEIQFLVLFNDEGQHSLWPVSLAVPAGWNWQHGPASRTDCLRFVETHWADIYPLSVQRRAAAARVNP